MSLNLNRCTEHTVVGNSRVQTVQGMSRWVDGRFSKWTDYNPV